MDANLSQVYCEKCKRTLWVEFSTNEAFTTSGLRQRSLIHNDHVLICDIDGNGTVRKSVVVAIEHNPLDILLDDIAQGFHHLNQEDGPPIIIECYTGNSHFKKFMEHIIVKLFEHLTQREDFEDMEFNIQSADNVMTLSLQRLHLSIGEYAVDSLPVQDSSQIPIRGLILDVDEAKIKRINIDNLVDNYNWSAIIVPKQENEGYQSALSSMFQAKEQPFFVDYLTNQNLAELFDFIFSLILQLDNME